MPPAAVAERYGRFAGEEAPGRSPSTPSGQEGSRPIPRSRRSSRASRTPTGSRRSCSPSRGCSVPPEGPYRGLGGVAARRTRMTVVAEWSRRSVQTNEPLRCAALLPALSGIEGPLALLEVGASAGSVPLPRPLLVPLSGRARPRPVRRRLEGRAGVVGHRRPPPADAGGGVARRHRPRSARRIATRRIDGSCRASCGRGRQGRAARIEAALDIARPTRRCWCAATRRMPACSSRWRRALRPARRWW